MSFTALLNTIPFRDLLPSSGSRVKIMEGAENNIPDEDAHRAAMEIHSLLEKLTEDDIVLALFSGKYHQGYVG